MACKDCVWLDVPPDKAGRRVARAKKAYKCGWPCVEPVFPYSINKYAPPHRQNAMVGITQDKIIVYVHCAKWRWNCPTPDRHDIWPVEWQWGVGRPVAA